MSRSQAGSRIAKGTRVLALIGLFGAALMLAALRVEHMFSTTLPEPTGDFAVGRALYDWTDAQRLDTLAPAPGSKRELLVWIWYPGTREKSAPVVADYLPASMRSAVEHARGPLMASWLTRDLSKVQAHSHPGSNVSLQQPSYPVVIMRGGASAEVWNYSSLAEDLASHGYVVVGFDAPYRTNVVAFPDGRVVRRTPENNPELALGAPDSARRINRLLAAWTGDIAFVLDRLQQLNASDTSRAFIGRLDMNRVGVFGHSFGGATAAQFCHDDSRCTAGIDVDGAPVGSVIHEGIPRPFMFLLSDHGDYSSTTDSRQIWGDIQSIYDRLPPNARSRIAIHGSYHYGFSDDGALLKSHLVMRALQSFGIIGIGGRRQLAITAYCLRVFFDRYLKGATPSPLTMSSPLYPEIQVLE